MADPGKLHPDVHPASHDWAVAMRFVAAQARARGLRGPDTVVLVPYAQLIHAARSAWVLAEGSGLLPRFESTLNWTRSLGAMEPSADDIHFDAALDALTARALLVRAGQAAQQHLLGPRVMEAAWSLAGLAAATEPSQRPNWGAHLAAALTVTGALPGPSPLLALEGVVARVALAWAAHSAFATDVLWAAEPPLLVILEGFQPDPLAGALRARLGERCVSWALTSAQALGAEAAFDGARLHPALNAEDEAHRAAACVLAHVAAGRSPVALVALDRQLTRRVRALLSEQGLAIRDETGWKLSTTRAAAHVVALLHAAAPDARTDDVLDWLKNAPQFDATEINVSEQVLRERGVRDWASAPPDLPLVGVVNAIRIPLQKRQNVPQCLLALEDALNASGLMDLLRADVAGQAVLQALHLHRDADDRARLFQGIGQSFSLHEFTAWASQTLESANHMPPHPRQHQVIILPLAQLLGREVQAVVLPGCDDERLQTSPEPPGTWTPAQRELLGLPSRESQATAHRAAWQCALRAPQVDVLWRCSDAGEPASPSPWVQLLQLHGALQGDDPRVHRDFNPRASHMPRPVAMQLPVRKLSASAYADLRQCPYKFFALRQLGLSESAELDAELDKRDFGNWLHRVLHLFYEGLRASSDEAGVVPGRQWGERLDAAAAQATQALALSDAEFLPFAASWPQLRDGYLHWLAEHESTGAHYAQGEVWKEASLPLERGVVTLVGKLDRIDRLADGTALLIDYKTEDSAKSAQRIKDGTEDTQLAFYAALLPDRDVSAAYLAVGEKGGTQYKPQPRIGELRDALLRGIASDLTRLAAGAPLPALGDGEACGYCSARGLCRKDMWS